MNYSAPIGLAAVQKANDRSAYTQLLDELEANARDTAKRMGVDWSSAIQGATSNPIHQALTLELWGLFDPVHYRDTYKDIAESDCDPLMHYVEYGDAEGRWPNPHFNPIAYRRHFESSGLGAVCSLYHYAVLGESLGLDSPGTFSARRYFVCNPDLKDWVDRPMTHFLHLGKPGGRVVHHRVRLNQDQAVKLPEKSTLLHPDHLDPQQGINVIGPLDKVSGLGVSARGYLQGLRLAGAPRVGSLARQIEFPRQSTIEQEVMQLPPLLETAPVNILHMNGDSLPLLMQHGGRTLLEDKYNIGVWYWELPVLRPEWQTSVRFFHEFWAPTPFIADILRRSTAKRVTVVPPYLDYLQTIEPVATGAHDEHRFVYCFDANSILERKNPGTLLDAFWQAFPPGSCQDRVGLTFKITYPDRQNPEVQRLYEAATADPRIRIVDNLLSDAELHHLIASATAYVSPHRSEGLGLTVIEAMAAGTPVICSSFGGLGHFINEATAFPLDYRSSEIASDHFPYAAGFVWADPQPQSLADCLKQALVDDQAKAAKRQAARAHVLDYFCSERLLQVYRDELDRLGTPKD